METTASAPPASAPAPPRPPSARPSSSVLRRYQAWRSLPGGSLAFDAAVALFAPFNASVAVHVADLSLGRATVEMRDRPWRRNHLGSLHAMAIGALAEITGNLVVMAALPEGAAMIVRAFSVEYLKKGRGTLTARCSVDPALILAGGDVPVSVEVVDRDGNAVARSTASCRVRLASA